MPPSPPHNDAPAPRPPSAPSPSPRPATPPVARAQLAAVLADTTKEVEHVKHQLADARRRGDYYKSLADSLQAVTGAPDDAVQTRVRHLEQRVRDAELQRDTEVARRVAMTDLWHQFRGYLEHVEYQARDARFAFDKVMDNGGGVLQLPRVPALNEVSPPPRTYTLDPSRNHVYKQQHQQQHTARPASASFPQLPPHPSSSRVRPRSDSLDGATYSNAVKRAKTDKPYQYPNHHHQSVPPPPPAGRHHYVDQRYSRPGPRSRSRSPSNASSGSMDVDEMLLQASTTNGQPHQQHLPGHSDHHSRQYRYPYPHPSSSQQQQQHPSPPQTRYTENAYPGASYSSSAQQQTHVFAPVVTGAPVKKGKLAPEGTLVDAAPQQPTSPFPSHNSNGERLCRQCGMVGRYKEGKCVEKWGPGPMGPGTVCDRCRKKMKRVERRGTIEQQQQAAQAQLAHLQHSSSAAALHPPGPPRDGRDAALASASPTHGPPHAVPPLLHPHAHTHREREREHHPHLHPVEVSVRGLSPSAQIPHSTSHSRPLSRARTPPPIAVDASAGVSNGAASQSQAKPRLIRPPSVHSQGTELSDGGLQSSRRSSVDADADADPDELDNDNDNDGEADEVDDLRQTEKEVEDDLLEAVDAAEANSASGASTRSARAAGSPAMDD